MKNIDIHITVTYSDKNHIPHKLLDHKIKGIPEVLLIETADKNMFVQSILENDNITKKKILGMIPVGSTQWGVSWYITEQKQEDVLILKSNKFPRKGTQRHRILCIMKQQPLERYKAEDFMKKSFWKNESFVGFEAGSRLSELYKQGFLKKEDIQGTNRSQYKLSDLFLMSELYTGL